MAIQLVQPDELPAAPSSGGMPVILFVDTFNRYLEPENGAPLCAFCGRLAGVFAPLPQKQQPLCCGRTFLSTGGLIVPEARHAG